VVDVPVEDRHPPDAVDALGDPGGDRVGVEQAEAHRGVADGVVAGRAGEHERVVAPAVEDRRDGFEVPTDGEQRGLERARADPRLMAELQRLARPAAPSTAVTCSAACTDSSSARVASRASMRVTCSRTPDPSSTRRVSEIRSGRSNGLDRSPNRIRAERHAARAG
jgi:hypothetical protein